MTSENTEKQGIKQKFKAYGNRLIHSEHMLLGVGIASFLESIIVPIPLEAILIPLMQAKRNAIWAISTVALLGCLVGATVGYLAGYFIFDWIGPELVQMFSSEAQYDKALRMMEQQGFWFVFSVGVIPIPFQIAMLAAGVSHYSYVLFIFASLLSRAIRYYGLGFLVWAAGNKAQRLFEKNRLAASALLTVVVLLIWWLVAF